MKLVECLTCGAPLSGEGKCRYCGNTFTNIIPDEISTDLSRATSSIRNGAFQEAKEILENIISSVDDHNSTVYFQKALAVNEIAYVEDPQNDNKRIPTFWNTISEQPFTEDDDIKLALKHATASERSDLTKSIQAIETLRQKYLELYKRLPAYDVFISYKATMDDGNPTKDSQKAREIYDQLTKQNLKVFFSGVTLVEYPGEEYEPIIYHAIQSSKIMIVYGSKVEYISSRWITNEWKRFKYYIDKRDKKQDSLIVLYNNLDPSRLPFPLDHCTAIENTVSSYDVLMRLLNNVLADSKSLERIEIGKAHITPKATKIERKDIKTIDLDFNQPTAMEVSIEEKFLVVNSYISLSAWDDASAFLERLKNEYPNSKQAARYALMIELKVKDFQSLMDYIVRLCKIKRFGPLKQAVDVLPISDAERLLKRIYNEIATNTFKDKAVDVLKIILPYNFTNRSQIVIDVLNKLIEIQNFAAFEYLLNALDENDVDRYVEFYFDYQNSSHNIHDISICIDRILKVDPWNQEALYKKVIIDILITCETEIFASDLEKCLSISDDVNRDLKAVFGYICDEYYKGMGRLAVQTLRYVDTDRLPLYYERIVQAATLCCKNSEFEAADKLNSLATGLSTQKDDLRVLENTLLVKTKKINIDSLSKHHVPLTDIPEYNNLLLHSGSNPSYQQRIIGIEIKQRPLIAELKRDQARRQRNEEARQYRERIREQNENNAREEQLQRLTIRKKHFLYARLIVLGVCAFVALILALASNTLFGYGIHYEVHVFHQVMPDYVFIPYLISLIVILYTFLFGLNIFFYKNRKSVILLAFWLVPLLWFAAFVFTIGVSSFKLDYDNDYSFHMLAIVISMNILATAFLVTSYSKNDVNCYNSKTVSARLMIFTIISISSAIIVFFIGYILISLLFLAVLIAIRVLFVRSISSAKVKVIMLAAMIILCVVAFVFGYGEYSHWLLISAVTYNVIGSCLWCLVLIPNSNTSRQLTNKS